MEVGWIIVAVIAACGIWFFYPRLPRIGQIIVAVLGIIACGIALLRVLGVPLSF